MTQQVGRGGSITLDAVFSDGTGTAVDPVGPTVEILDPDDVQVVAPTTPDRNPSTGRYEYDYAVGAAAALGAWTARWSGTINTVVVSDDDVFTVVAAGEVEFPGLTESILTLTEAYRAINDPTNVTTVTGGGSGTHDDELTIWLNAITQRIEDLCGPVVNREVTELHDGGAHRVFPRSTPVYAVTSVTEYADTTATVLAAETNAAKTSDDYLVDGTGGHHRSLARRSSGGDATFASGRQNVEVVYDAGRATSTSTVPSKFKMAAGAILRRLWARESGSWAQGGDPFAIGDGPGAPGFFKAIDPMVAEFLADELHPTGIA